MVVIDVGIVTVENLEQFANALAPIVARVFGKIIGSKFVQPENALAPMLVTDVDIVTSTNAVQPWKAFAPMIVTEFGITTDVNPVLFRNADAAMLVTLYVAPPTTKLDNKVMLPEADALVPTLADTVPTV